MLRMEGDPCVMDLLRNLNLTAEEEAIADFSDEEDEGMEQPECWGLVGKVLTPAILHVNTIISAMIPAWGNPYGLKIRSIGEKVANMFVVEFGSSSDMDRVLVGSPWMVGRYAVILQRYDETLSATEITFEKMDIWV